MVLRVVLSVISQCSQPRRCYCTSARISVVTESSIRSSSMARNSVHVTFHPNFLGPFFPAEVTAESFAELQPGTQQARFHSGDAQAESFRRVLGRKSLDIA